MVTLLSWPGFLMGSARPLKRVPVPYERGREASDEWAVRFFAASERAGLSIFDLEIKSIVCVTTLCYL